MVERNCAVCASFETRLAPEAQRLVEAIEAVMRLTWGSIGAGQMLAVA